MTSTTSYRGHFDESEAEAYAGAVYGDRSHATLVWEVQRGLIDRLLDREGLVPTRESYLDFACGTGRILEAVAPRFERSVGLDISASMLARAAARVPGADLRLVDISEDPGAVEGPFDLVTMFRFVLNAEPDDVAAALAWVRSRLRDDESRVLANNHGNLGSYMVGYKTARVALRRDFRRRTGNLLWHKRLVETFRDGGFEVEDRIGCGVLPEATLHAVGYDRMLGWERRLQASAGRVGFDQLYVLRPA